MDSTSPSQLTITELIVAAHAPDSPMTYGRCHGCLGERSMVTLLTWHETGREPVLLCRACRKHRARQLDPV